MDSISAVLLILYFMMVIVGGILFNKQLDMKTEISKLKEGVEDNKSDFKLLKEDSRNHIQKMSLRLVGLESYLVGQSIKAKELKAAIAEHPDDKVHHIIINPGYFKFDDIRELKSKYTIYEVENFSGDFNITYIEED